MTRTRLRCRRLGTVASHAEFAPEVIDAATSGIKRSVYGRVTWTF